MNKIGIGIIGCGNISDIYLKNLLEVFRVTDVIGCADLDNKRAINKANEYNIKAFTIEELLENPEIELIVNLTIPNAHTEVNMKILEAGKHLYCEKPIAINRADAHKTLSFAKMKGLRVGCAPDTFLGAGLQTCKKLIDDGWIGKPIAATAFMACHGHESWHPNPEFYYKKGGGPMFDMGPYYLTALVSLLGSVKRLSSSVKISFSERLITSKPLYGEKINVETPTHITGIMDFKHGAVATIITSFDVWDSNLPKLEVYGTEGTLSVPDPNTFGGPIFFKRKFQDKWAEIPLLFEYEKNSRGIGVADMALAIISKTKHRANGELALHIVDIMQGFCDASVDGKYLNLESTVEKPDSLLSETGLF